MNFRLANGPCRCREQVENLPRTGEEVVENRPLLDHATEIAGLVQVTRRHRVPLHQDEKSG
jgi:hypothetical protein